MKSLKILNFVENGRVIENRTQLSLLPKQVPHQSAFTRVVIYKRAERIGFEPMQPL